VLQAAGRQAGAGGTVGEWLITEPFMTRFVQASEALVVGDPLDERVDMGPMIDTREMDRIESWVQETLAGGVIVNDTPAFRADHMLYGGNRQSGLGRDGVRFAMEDMTNIQMVAIRLR
jgi:acyl-CoA reductase-like NAD-dependent aldehyde dehydrogenase